MLDMTVPLSFKAYRSGPMTSLAIGPKWVRTF